MTVIRTFDRDDLANCFSPIQAAIAGRLAITFFAVFVLAGCGPKAPSTLEHPELAGVQVSVKQDASAHPIIGFVVSHDGLIVTSLHNLNPAEIRVTLSDGRDVRGTLLEADEKDDLALLKIEAGKLPFLQLDSHAAEPGLHLRAMGFNGAMVHGIFEHWENGGNDINFTATVGAVPGGAPLLSDDGRVIGVVHAPIPGKTTEYLATPIWRVVRMMPRLSESGTER